jgi:HSP20 family protein
MLNTVFTNDVRQTLDFFRRSVDQLFDDFYRPETERPAAGNNEAAQRTFSPVLETGWDENALHLRAIVPGVAQNDITVNLQGNQLVISGERKAPEGFVNNGWTQLAYGKFATGVTLPNGLNLDQVKCRLHDGVLDIDIPVAEAMKPRQVPIQSGPQQKAIRA